MRAAKRYEIYLPLRYNDGTRIERRKFQQVERELLEEFGGFTAMQQDSLHALRGFWEYKGQVYQDEIVLFTVYTFEEFEGAEVFLSHYKQVLKEKFRQEEVLLTAQTLEVI